MRRNICDRAHILAPPLHEPRARLGVRLLVAIGKRSGSDGRSIGYAPTVWLGERPTPKRRKRWSRWTHRLAQGGLIRRLTEPQRDRVREVKITRSGWRWLIEHCGPGAVTDQDGIAWDAVA